MKKLLGFTGLAAIVAATFIVGGATAGGSSAFTVGGFQGATSSSTPNIGFSAHFNGQGNAIGYVTETIAGPGIRPPFQVRYNVVCLSVIGNVASMGIIVTQSASNDLPVGLQRILTVQDTGVPGGAGDLYAFYTGQPASACNATLFPAGFAITKGDIWVHG